MNTDGLNASRSNPGYPCPSPFHPCSSVLLLEITCSDLALRRNALHESGGRADAWRGQGQDPEQPAHFRLTDQAMQARAEGLRLLGSGVRAEALGAQNDAERLEEVALGHRPMRLGPGRARGAGERGEIDMRRQVRLAGLFQR